MKFSNPKSQKIINSFVKADFSPLKGQHPPLFHRVKTAQGIVRQLGLLRHNRDECYLDSCAYSQAEQRQRFLQVMKQATPDGKKGQSTPANLEEPINWLYVYAMRFAKELELTLPSTQLKGLNETLQAARKGLQGDITDPKNPQNLIQYTTTGEPTSLKELLWWGLYDIPLEVLKGQIAELASSTGWAEKLASMQKEIGERQKEIEAQKTEVEKLQKKIEDQKTEGNFVLLNKGFSRLAESLRKQKKDNSIEVFIWRIVIVLWPIFIFCLAAYQRDFISSAPWYELLLTASPLATVEVVGVYLYRVALLRQRSLEAQLLQVDLRMQLCAFVQGYATFAKEIQANAPETLRRFEDLIFSGIAVDPEQVPSATDGIEPLAQLIQVLKEGAK